MDTQTHVDYAMSNAMYRQYAVGGVA